MVKKWFRLFFDKQSVKQSSGKLARFLHRPSLWHLSAQSFSRGVAVGLFTACVPVMPFQTLLAIFLSITLQANFAVAFAVSWVSNPLTLIPMTYFTYWIGKLVLGETNTPITINDFSWQTDKDLWPTFLTWLQQFGKAFFVGLPIIAFGAAILGYFIGLIIWHCILYFTKH